MDYCSQLRKSARAQKSIVCMGLDPVLDYLPPSMTSGNVYERLMDFYQAVFGKMLQRNVRPGAFKPNIGYFSRLDAPRVGDFSGSRALAGMLNMLSEQFPGVPVILDSKRGDIATSSMNYAVEAFESWKADAVTISPYMGSDSVGPFISYGKGVYILCRTSNPGAADLQDLIVDDMALFTRVAGKIMEWAAVNPGTGAVVGATSPEELSIAVSRFAGKEVPLLIPGVGSQGGSGSETVTRLMESGYDPLLARINSSSGITHPWKSSPIPGNWVEVVVDSLEKLNEETGSILSWE